MKKNTTRKILKQISMSGPCNKTVKDKQIIQNCHTTNNTVSSYIISVFGDFFYQQKYVYIIYNNKINTSCTVVYTF